MRSVHIAGRFALGFAGAAVAVAAVAGCSSTDSTSSPTPSSSPPLDPTISVGSTADDKLAAIDALHVCFVQNSALTNLSEIQADLDKRLAAAGVTQQQYNDFTARLKTDPQLSALKLKYYREGCGGTPAPEVS